MLLRRGILISINNFQFFGQQQNVGSTDKEKSLCLLFIFRFDDGSIGCDIQP
jgi:hypothetical protein